MPALPDIFTSIYIKHAFVLVFKMVFHVHRTLKPGMANVSCHLRHLISGMYVDLEDLCLLGCSTV